MAKSFLLKKYSLDQVIVFSVIFLMAVIVARQIFGYGTDYKAYQQIFTSDVSVEPFWRFFRFLSNCIGKNWHLLIFFTTFYSLYLKEKFFCKCTDGSYQDFLILFYFLTFYWLHEYTQYRVSLAIGLFVLTYPFVRDKKLYYFILTFLIVTVHYSALILVPFLFYLKIGKRKSFYVLFPTLCFLGVFIFKATFREMNIIEIFLEKYNLLDSNNDLILKIISYKQNKGSLSFFNQFYLLFLFILYASYYISIRKRHTVNQYFYYSFQALSYGISIFYLMLLTPYSIITLRLSEFFLPFFVPLIVGNLKNVKEKFEYLLISLLIVALISKKLLTATGRL